MTNIIRDHLKTDPPSSKMIQHQSKSSKFTRHFPKSIEICRWTNGFFVGFAGANSTTGLLEILQELLQLQDPGDSLKMGEFREQKSHEKRSLEQWNMMKHEEKPCLQHSTAMTSFNHHIRVSAFPLTPAFCQNQVHWGGFTMLHLDPGCNWPLEKV